MSNSDNITPSFLSGGGEMGQIIRDYDWRNSELGDPESWPQPLKTTLRILLSTGHPMFIWWGPNLIQFYNDAYRPSIGPERHPSAIGQRGRECWAEIWDIIGPQIDHVLSGKGHTWQENQLVPITRNGRREDVYWTYSYGPIDDPDQPNDIGGILVVCSETTKQVKTELKLKAREQRWRSLFNESHGFITITRGPDHIYEYVNPQVIKTTGKTSLVGKSIRESFPEQRYQHFIELIDQVYKTGEPYYGKSVPISFARENGEVHSIYVDFVFQAIRDDDGNICGIFTDGYEITDSVIANKKLQEESKQKDAFLAMLAHELRNPLAPIRNASELLVDAGSHNQENIVAIGEMLKRQTSHLAHLVDDLLDISRINKNVINLQRQPTCLNQLLHDAIKTSHDSFVEKGQTLKLDIPEALLYISGDPTRITQVISNLISNASKYTHIGGEIKITLKSESEHAVFTITDNGIGISAETLPKIYDMFFQADQSLDRSQGGLGIGLSIVSSMVKMHGGTLDAFSEGPDKGSQFVIRLPLIEAPSEAAPYENTNTTEFSKVLIVDDNSDAANSLAMLLSLEGHETMTAHNHVEAFNYVDQCEPDFIILDIGLPEVNGYEMAQKLSKRPNIGRLIALTGYGTDSDIKQAMDVGFNHHFTKPVDLSALRKILSS